MFTNKKKALVRLYKPCTVAFGSLQWQLVTLQWQNITSTWN